MPYSCQKNSLSYPKVRVRYDGLYYIEFRLLAKRFRLFSGSKISSSLSPNSYPAKMRKAITTELAKEVYEYLINNDYSFEKKVSKLELYDSLVAKKLAEPLSATYKKTLNNLSVKLRHELQKKGSIKPTYIDKPQHPLKLTHRLDIVCCFQCNVECLHYFLMLLLGCRQISSIYLSKIHV